MSEERRIPEHLVKLLASSIETAERLDILLHLRAHPTRSFGARAVAAAVGGSSVQAEQHLAILCGRGFLTVSIGADLLYGYQPVSPAVDVALKEIEVLNRERRADLIATMQDTTERDPVHAFANAFLVRKRDRKGGNNE
ncbi:MAG TPA: hypothetical protein VM925_05060 [Labilithrix sp.]|jgi:hypothetical protein|nr:hypothetical protein [Labilithrix sp.]